MRVYLIGYMGSGKTKTAEALGKLLKIEVLDLDTLISEKESMSISDIFKIKGEAYFRQLEREQLHQTGQMSSAVISTGGGTPCYFNNMEWMNEQGITVYLEASPGLLFHRLSSSKAGRPLIEKLDDVGLMEQISGHLLQRIPFYQKAKIVVPAASLQVKSLAEKILKLKDDSA